MTTNGPRVGRTLADSVPAPRAPEDRTPRPNIVLIVIDDMGFGDLGCYGSTIATPNIDALAARGLRSRAFHVTAVCSPTRASLLTGRNSHAIGMGTLTDFPMAFPAYESKMPPQAATLPRILRDAGYVSFALGKWHLLPPEERQVGGPFERWPLQLGFDRYYGFLDGAIDQYEPVLTRDNTPIPTPSRPDYHLTEDLADQAIAYLDDLTTGAPERPFLLYFATGAMHSPHQVPEQWIAPYAGAFDEGWDVARERIHARQVAEGIIPADAALSPRPDWVSAWDELGEEERRLFARQMEVYAGFLTHTDAQIGRVLDRIAALGKANDTIVVLVADNGASAEGGAAGMAIRSSDFTDPIEDRAERNRRTQESQAEIARHPERLGSRGVFNHYSWGWAFTGNTPFPLWKRYTWLGGVRVPFIVSWPGELPAGEVRDQFGHAIDLMPTLLEAVGLEPPETVGGYRQMPVHGASLLETWRDADAPAPRTTQYFETLGSRAIYSDGWIATTDHVDWSAPDEARLMPGSHEFETDRWSLHHLETDFSQVVDLADEHPGKLRELVENWWLEAGRYGALPLVSGQFYGAATPERRAVTLLHPDNPFARYVED